MGEAAEVDVSLGAFGEGNDWELGKEAEVKVGEEIAEEAEEVVGE